MYSKRAPSVTPGEAVLRLVRSGRRDAETSGQVI